MSRFIKIEVVFLPNNAHYEVRVTKQFDAEHGGGTQTFRGIGGVNPHRALDVAKEMITVSPSDNSIPTALEFFTRQSGYRDDDNKP